jgi:hypothetical protein
MRREVSRSPTTYGRGLRRERVRGGRPMLVAEADGRISVGGRASREARARRPGLRRRYPFGESRS